MPLSPTSESFLPTTAGTRYLIISAVFAGSVISEGFGK
jgi:hypothetical protein